jgi:drug/metabolite transporter (DMT)-like permease
MNAANAPKSRFRPLEVFVRRPPELAAGEWEVPVTRNAKITPVNEGGGGRGRGASLRDHLWQGPPTVVVGFIGILVMLAPYAEGAASTLGSTFAISGAVCSAGSVIQTRGLTETETTSSIVFYFSLICAVAGLATWPLGWLAPAWPELAAPVTIGLCGGLAHILLTESYRLAPASVVAPFDYTSMVWVFLLGYFFFKEIPSMFVFIGAAIIAGAGLFVIWRERQLGLQRVPAAEGPPTGG